MNQPANIRNISVIAHVDHGKTTLSDSLVSRAGIIPEKTSGGIRYMSVRKDEIERGITIKSSSVSLYFELTDSSAMPADTSSPNFLINLIDSPGHVDFSSEVTAALRVTDGALVVVDSVEGVCVQTEVVLRQAITERIKPILFVNKVDRLLLELQSDADDMYELFRRVIESTNAVIASVGIEDESAMGSIELSPLVGNVGFGSGYQGWGFTLRTFAKIYEAKLGVPAHKLVQKLWGDNYYDTVARKWSREAVTEDGRKLERGFCHFILKPIRQITQAVMSENYEALDTILQSIGVEVPAKEREALSGKPKDLLKFVMRRFLPVSDCILEMVVMHLPSPLVAQKYRTPHLYEGPLDDESARAMAACDPKGPLMMYVSKMVPWEGGRFIAFGRVFSGTVSAGATVRIQGPDYNPDAPVRRDLHVKKVQGVVLMMGRKNESLDQCPCGNIIGLTGIDQFIVKTGTITSSEVSYNIASMKFSVSPVVRVSVQPKNPADLPRLVEGLKRLAKTDPAILVTTEETGEHVVAAVGELQLEVCLGDLRDLASCEIISSNPVVTYRETVTEKSAVCLSKSPNKHNRVYMTAEPIGSQLVEDIEAGRVNGDMETNPRAHLLAAEYGWENTEARKIWSFGPDSRNGTNLLVDMTTGQSYLNESKEFIVNSFQWASKEGVLCGENMSGVRFNLVDLMLIADSIHRGGGQVIPASRRVMYASALSAKPRLQEPVYLLDIQAPNTVMAGVQTVIKGRRGTIVECEPKSLNIFSIRAHLPVSESFGITSELQSRTGGRAFLQMSFDHWAMVDSDPLDRTSKSSAIVRDIRVRKGLSADIPPIGDYLDRL
eukprot:gene6811-7916_t